jgi:hypothetical protein
MSEHGLRPSDRVKLRIISQLEASKQFLVILIGLAVANAVAEKLKYSLDGSVLGLRIMSRDAALDQIPTRVLFAGNDPVYNLLFNTEAAHVDLFVLLVFFVYVTRFFFNNYTYLSEYYGESAIDAMGNARSSLLSLKLSSTFDLALSVFTGIIICLISMVLTPRRIVVLIGFVVLHYIVDGALLAVSTVRTLMNVEDPAGATDTSRKKLLSYRAACWISNRGITPG